MPYHPVDVYVGNKMRLARLARGVSQTALGDKLGLTFQQVQKYEKGANRISASRLYEMAQLLGVEISYFFAGIPPTKKSGSIEDLPITSREQVSLSEAFINIKSNKTRSMLLDLAERLAKEHGIESAKTAVHGRA